MRNHGGHLQARHLAVLDCQPAQQADDVHARVWLITASSWDRSIEAVAVDDADAQFLARAFSQGWADGAPASCSPAVDAEARLLRDLGDPPGRADQWVRTLQSELERLHARRPDVAAYAWPQVVTVCRAVEQRCYPGIGSLPLRRRIAGAWIESLNRALDDTA